MSVKLVSVNWKDALTLRVRTPFLECLDRIINVSAECFIKAGQKNRTFSISTSDDTHSTHRSLNFVR
jgi:hypothetical protein